MTEIWKIPGLPLKERIKSTLIAYNWQLYRLLLLTGKKLKGE